jgi:two-component system LytT family response regulator
MSILKALIVDDELSAIESLKWELNNYCKEIKVIDSFTNPVEAISAINYLKPELVFLDIEMPEMDGFQLLHELKYRQFHLIITTAYNQYAIQAFKEDAVDYLLKPVDPDELKKAIDKVRNRLDSSPEQLERLVEKLLQKEPDNLTDKVPLALSDRVVMVDKSDIMYCASDGNYTHVMLKGETKYLLSKTLKVVESILNDPQFVRVHKKYLVNIHYIKEYTRGDGGYILMENAKEIPVSRMHKESLLRALHIVS